MSYSMSAFGRDIVEMSTIKQDIKAHKAIKKAKVKQAKAKAKASSVKAQMNCNAFNDLKLSSKLERLEAKRKAAKQHLKGKERAEALAKIDRKIKKLVS